MAIKYRFAGRVLSSVRSRRGAPFQTRVRSGNEDTGRDSPAL